MSDVDTAGGPTTVTLTDDELVELERSARSSYVSAEMVAEVERIVAARVGALTADLAAAELKAHVFVRIAEEYQLVIANVRALADEWAIEGPDLVCTAYSGRDVHEGTTLENCANAVRALLPAVLVSSVPVPVAQENQ